MNRREFLVGAAATVGAGFAGCKSGCPMCGVGAGKGKILFGACRGIGDAQLMKSIGYDFTEWSVPAAVDPTKDDAWWRKQRDAILAAALPLRSCNGFLPGTFRLTGPKADHDPALDYAERAVRRAAEVGVKTVVFGSGSARNVPGDYTVPKGRPDVERGVAQYTDFCRALTKRIADLNEIAVVIEPLRPNESNIINFVWQGVAICRDVNSPKLAQLADIFHMMMGGESADSIRLAGPLLKHCHIATYATRKFPGSDPSQVEKFKPYFDALKDIGYSGGVSCECGWGDKKIVSDKKVFAKNLETALKTMKGLV